MADADRAEPSLGLLRLGYGEPLLEVTALRWDGAEVTGRTELIAEETPVALIFNGIPHVVMMATPQDLEDFVLGFSLTEELIRTPADLERIEVVRYSRGIELQATVSPDCEAAIAPRTRNLAGRTGCGICGAESLAAVLKTPHNVAAGGSVAPEAIQRALAGLVSHQSLNASAGAVHAAAWATAQGVIEVAREDVGRHNALDKLVGAVLKRGIDPTGGFVLVTSRASFEMVQKTAVLGSPVLAAISGPTGLAVRVAEQSGLTLVGFARGSRLTVYTHPHRIRSPA